MQLYNCTSQIQRILRASSVDPRLVEVGREQPRYSLSGRQCNCGKCEIKEGSFVHERNLANLSRTLDVGIHRIIRGNYSAHACSADRVDRYSSFLYCSNHADVGQAARAAATKDQPERPACEKPREAIEIIFGAKPDMMGAIDTPPLQPGLRLGRPFIAIFMQEYQMRPGESLPRAVLLDLFFDLVQPRIAASEANGEDAVGLPEAAARPVRGGGVCLVDHILVLRLKFIQPAQNPVVVRPVLGCVCGVATQLIIYPIAIENQSGSEPAEGLGKPVYKVRNRCFLSGRDDSKAKLFAHRPLGPDATPETDDDLARDSHHGLGVHVEQALEFLSREHHQFAVANGDHRGGPWFVRQNGHLADHLTAPHFADGDFIAFLFHHHAKPPADKDVEAICDIPLPHERLSAREMHPFEAILEFPKN